MLVFTEGSWLEYWYDWYLAVPALLVAAYLTLRTMFSMPWTRRNALIARVLTLLGTALAAVVALDIFEIETVPLDTFDDDIYGYLSVGGAASASLISLIGMFAYRGGRGRRPKNKKVEPVEEAPSAQDELMADLAAVAEAGDPADTMVLGTVGGAMAWLVVHSGGEPGSIIELTGTGMMVGRDSASDVYLDHPSVSGSHALIREYRGAYSLSDLGSSNGTRINGALEAGAVLKDGSRISIGASELHYTLVTPGEAETEGGIESAEAPAAQTGVLLVKSGPAMGKSFRTEQGDLLIGRQAGYGGVNIDDPAISALHAMLRQMPRGARLYDLGSVNGTAVDDVPIAGVELKDGDVLRFGDAEVQFVLGD